MLCPRDSDCKYLFYPVLKKNLAATVEGSARSEHIIHKSDNAIPEVVAVPTIKNIVYIFKPFFRRELRLRHSVPGSDN